MEKFLRDSGHLIRPAIVLLAALGLFMVIRGAVVPKGFGQYGPFRPGALAELTSKLGDEGINIDYCYGTLSRKGPNQSVIVDVSNIEAAVKLLQG